MIEAGNSTVVPSDDTPRHGVLVACVAIVSIAVWLGLVICAKESFKRLMGPAPPHQDGYNAL